jgi:ParB family chromosome partitioning protein
MTTSFKMIPLSELTIAANVRTETRVDKPFITNIKQHGIRVPIIVTQREDGGYDVVDGQRRTLAARDAGLTVMPSVIQEPHTSDKDRLIEQIVVNDQRAELTTAERAKGYQQLSLFGLGVEQIARRTNAPKADVAAAVTVTASKTGSDLLEASVSLEDAAAIVEFEDYPNIVEQLQATALQNPSGFAHKIANYREQLALTAQISQRTKELADEGIEIASDDDNLFDRSRYMLVGSLFVDDAALAAGTALAANDSRPDPVPEGLVAVVRVDRSWRAGEYVTEVVTQYYVRDWLAAGYITHKFYMPAVAEEKSEKQLEAEKAERKLVRTNNAAWPTATAVRREWIRSQLLERKQLPSEAAHLVAMFQAGELPVDNFDRGIREALDWLDIAKRGSSVQNPVGPWLKKNPHRADHLNLALALAGVERVLDPKDAWRRSDGRGRTPGAYLEQLAAWGYGLSDVEKHVIVEGKKK